MSRLVARCSAAVAVILCLCGADCQNNPAAPGSLSCNVSPTAGQAPLQVTFSASAENAGDGDFRWVFSDGAAATGATARRTLSSGGSFSGTVRLATSEQTCTTPAVNVESDVRLTCTADPERVVAPGEVQFRANPAGGSGGFSYQWEFGDGAASSEKDPSHIYRSVGTFTARVTARSGGNTATCVKTIQAFAEGLSVTCSANPEAGPEPLEVTFRAEVTGEGTGNPYTFNWLFGDGGSSPNRLSYHTYQNGGRYEAVVTVQSGPEVARCRKNIRVFRCGDGQINGGDQCDDGNRRDDDGCSSTCQIETGYVCKKQPSLCTPICGDGLLRGPETKPKGCDDGNTTNGDGCDSTCKVEPGFTCVGEPSVCT